MKNLYLALPLLVASLVGGTASVAQSAKPQPEKTTNRVRTMVPVVAHPVLGLEQRGGANNECATAIAITVAAECSGSIASYDATDATESQPAATCNTYTSPEARDLWFSFVATSTVTTAQVEGTLSFDPVIEGFSGDCGTLVSMGCSDATFPPAEPENTTETLNMVTAVGTTYYVRVYSYWAPEPVDFGFSLCIFAAPDAPANDLCSGTTPVALTSGATVTFTGDNTNALDTEGLGNGSVWHSFTITECLNLTLDYCGTDPAFGNALLGLFMDCPGTMVFGAANFDTETCPDGNVTIYYEFVPAGTYYYAVIKDEVNGAVGPYTVNVTASPLAPGYCDATAEACDEYIAQVTVGVINNTSECADGPIVDYTSQSTDIMQGETISITVLNGPVTYALDAVSVFIDWNQNESFCELNETVTLATADEGVTFTGDITAPGDALAGSTRMRVRMVYDEVPQACGVSAYGEIEDYTINVTQFNGVDEFTNSEWAVFPNPNNGDMTIRFGGSDAKVAIELFDVAGRTIHQEQRQLSNGQQVDLGLAGTLANGMYTLRLTTTEGRSEQRVIVQ